jgi:hypothetical protein
VEQKVLPVTTDAQYAGRSYPIAERTTQPNAQRGGSEERSRGEHGLGGRGVNLAAVSSALGGFPAAGRARR